MREFASTSFRGVARERLPPRLAASSRPGFAAATPWRKHGHFGTRRRPAPKEDKNQQSPSNFGFEGAADRIAAKARRRRPKSRQRSPARADRRSASPRGRRTGGPSFFSLELNNDRNPRATVPVRRSPRAGGQLRWTSALLRRRAWPRAASGRAPAAAGTGPPPPIGRRYRRRPRRSGNAHQPRPSARAAGTDENGPAARASIFSACWPAHFAAPTAECTDGHQARSVRQASASTSSAAEGQRTLAGRRRSPRAPRAIADRGARRPPGMSRSEDGNDSAAQRSRAATWNCRRWPPTALKREVRRQRLQDTALQAGDIADDVQPRSRHPAARTPPAETTPHGWEREIQKGPSPGMNIKSK